MQKINAYEAAKSAADPHSPIPPILITASSHDNEQSEEIEDEDSQAEEEDEEDGAEYHLNDSNVNDVDVLRNYDERGAYATEENANDDDEFFLISTPSPFSLAHLSTKKSGEPHEFELIDQDELMGEDEAAGNFLVPNEDDSENTSDFAARHQLRYQTMYEVNRLSNIIEEEEQAELQHQLSNANNAETADAGNSIFNIL